MPFKKGEVSNPGGKKPKYALGSLWNKRYSMAKAQAKYRKEEWAFDSLSWMKVWELSGVMEHIDVYTHSYNMVRLDPIEAWGPTNCIIVSRRMHLSKRAYESFHKNMVPKTDWKRKHGVLKNA